ncbi:Thaumatin protein [Spatholobus suberectus]|nr:Thaumatin protein [Spatholobus suberectus]
MIILLKALLLVIALCFTSAYAARFNITNQCPYISWAAAVPGGGRRLNSGQSWALDLPEGTKGARIWARTGCNFNGSGLGRCQTGDCGGLLSSSAKHTVRLPTPSRNMG